MVGKGDIPGQQIWPTKKGWTMPSTMRIIPNLCACFLLPNVSKTRANVGKNGSSPKMFEGSNVIKKTIVNHQS